MGCVYAEVVEALGKPSIAAAHVAVSRALVRLAKEISLERRCLAKPLAWCEASKG
jgi:hypothetical protein